MIAVLFIDLLGISGLSVSSVWTCAFSVLSFAVIFSIQMIALCLILRLSLSVFLSWASTLTLLHYVFNWFPFCLAPWCQGWGEGRFQSEKLRWQENFEASFVATCIASQADIPHVCGWMSLAMHDGGLAWVDDSKLFEIPGFYGFHDLISLWWTYRKRQASLRSSSCCGP